MRFSIMVVTVALSVFVVSVIVIMIMTRVVSLGTTGEEQGGGGRKTYCQECVFQLLNISYCLSNC